MRFRKLRIAWSVFWGLAAVLLIVLWVRSYWWIDGISGNRGRHYIYADVHSGLARFARIVPTGQFPPVPWRAFSHSLRESDLEAAANSSKGNHRALGFQWRIFGNGWNVAVPIWFPALICGGLAAVPLGRPRFTLRTLLIATTLVAVVLGLIVWLSHN